jgi:hypothetical protein
MAAQFLVICAWCNRTLATAPAGSPVTHTICPLCFEWSLMHRSAESRLASGDTGSALVPASHFDGCAKH